MIKPNVGFTLAVTGLVLISAGAQASTVYGLSTRDQLIRFDSAAPSVIQQATFITGLASNESLVGLDFRPTNALLYGLGSFGRLYTINTMTGASTFVSSLFNSITSAPISLMGTEFGVDFNPVPNRLRVVSNLGQNLRINVDTGSTIVDGMLNQASGNPFIVASAYTNNFAGATTTTLFNLDSASDMLTRQVPPNAGTQVSVGALGADITALAGFDIRTVSSIDSAFAAVQLAGTSGSKFGSVNLTTGAFTQIGHIGMDQTSDSLAVRDIALPVPEPASMTILALGALALLRKKKLSK